MPYREEGGTVWPQRKEVVGGDFLGGWGMGDGSFGAEDGSLVTDARGGCSWDGIFDGIFDGISFIYTF